MDITQDERRRFAMSGMRPTPGQSLTNNPEILQPYERPPEFVTKEDALDFFLESFLKEDKYNAIMEVLEAGTPVMDLVQLFVMEAFKAGKINPNMMLLLAEPLAYILLGLAEREGIRADDAYGFKNILREKLQEVTDPQDDEEGSLQQKLDSLPSLMSQGEE